MADYQVDALVIGAGVVGLAVARELALAGREVIVVEAEDRIGTGVSGRNSEVIHAGIYYSQGSLKAKTCVQGKELLYRYCQSRGIPHRRCGKLIVATSAAQLAQLRILQKRAEANQVVDLQLLSAGQLYELEPEITAVGALLSPSTGIIDCHHLMWSLQGDIEAAGGWVVLNSPVINGVVRGKLKTLSLGGRQPCEVAADIVINSAGLQASKLLTTIEGFPEPCIPPLYLAKGDYFALAGPSSFRHLIYPLPEPGGLGIHLTLDLSGQARFGPDVEWVNTLAYDVLASKENRFKQAIAQYWPAVAHRQLNPGYAGIRPKLAPKGDAVADFRLETPVQHGIAGWYNLLGIESPGLTAALALATHVADKISAD